MDICRLARHEKHVRGSTTTLPASAHAVSVMVAMMVAASSAWAGGGPNPGNVPVTTVPWGHPIVLAITQVGLIGTTLVWRWWRR